MRTVWLLSLGLWFTATMGWAQTKPIPMPQEQVKADALIDEVYQDEIQKAKTEPAAKLRLAQIFLQEGRDTQDLPAGRYRLFMRAKQLAAEAGDAATALQAVEELGSEFSFTPKKVLEMKIEALQQAAKAPEGTPESYRNVLQTGTALVEDLNDRHDYASALEILKGSEFAGKKLKSIALVANIRKRMAETEENRKAFAPYQGYMDTLATNPEDLKANQALGKYFGFEKGDWVRALPYLAKSGGTVGELAKADLAFPSSVDAQLKLASGWQKAASSPQGLSRAYFWYQVASTEASAKQHKEIQAQLDTIKKSLPDNAAQKVIEREVRVLESPGPVYTVAISPDGRKIASGGSENYLQLWDAKMGKEIRRLEGHQGRIWTAHFSGDGRRVVSGSFDNTARVWDLVSGRELRKLPHGEYVRGAVFGMGDKVVLTGGDNRLAKLWDVESGQELKTFKGHDHTIWSVALSRDGTKALTGSLDRTARVWDVSTGNEIQKLAGHTDTVLAVAFSPSGKRAVTGSTDHTIKLWDLQTGKVLHTFSGHKGYVHSVAFSPDGRYILSAGQDRTVRVWDVVAKQLLKTLEGHTDQVWQAQFSPDGRWASSGGQDKSIRIWSGN